MENEIRNSRGRKAKKKSDVFISWSGTNSKEIKILHQGRIGGIKFIVN